MPVVLVFAKEPRLGRVKTRLAASLGAAAACALYEAFLADLARALARLPEAVDVEWWVDGDPEVLAALAGPRAALRVQPAGDLGDRLQAAFASALGAGRGPAAAVGTDCPLLGPEHVAALWEALGRGADAALVPAEDGGYAALALAAPSPEAFEGIPWSTDGVLEVTLRRLRGAGKRVELLAPLRDADDLGDLERLAEQLAGRPEAAPASAAAVRGVLGPPGQGGPRPAAAVDALGREVPLAPLPRRILSLVPSVTECLFDLGAGERVVGRTDYCIAPAGRVESLPSVGGPKTVDVAAAAALAPDLVLANAEENDRAQVEALAARGVRVHVAFPRTLGEAARFLEDLGLLLGAREAAGACARRLRAEAARAAVAPVPVACLIWKGPYLTASDATFTSAVLAAAGGANVFGDREGRYPAVTLAELAAARPRVVLLPSEPYDFGARDVREVEAAVPGAAALLCPGEWVTWYGCRVAEAVRDLRRLLDPYREAP
ncbi:MAG: TIGR04282 family arsenosugar biosynthesis glycosyltransferase [Thermodesulfobacteriota bacterium]